MFRCRMYNVKCNFRKKYQEDNLLCDLHGCDQIDTQEHIFTCKPLIDSIGRTTQNVYSNIFSDNLETLLNVGKELVELVTKRKILTQETESSPDI